LPAPGGPRILRGMTETLETLLATLLGDLRTRDTATVSLDELATHVESARVDTGEIAWLIEALEREGVEVESPPSEARVNLHAVLRAARTLRARFGRAPTPEELTAETGLTPEAVRGALFLGQVLGRG
jgi:hypothetical protein